MIRGRGIEMCDERLLFCRCVGKSARHQYHRQLNAFQHNNQMPLSLMRIRSISMATPGKAAVR
jgi:hypothetical protein